jgi:hypothetical protein
VSDWLGSNWSDMRHLLCNRQWLPWALSHREQFQSTQLASSTGRQLQLLDHGAVDRTTVTKDPVVGPDAQMIVAEANPGARRVTPEICRFSVYDYSATWLR